MDTTWLSKQEDTAITRVSPSINSIDGREDGHQVKASNAVKPNTNFQSKI